MAVVPDRRIAITHKLKMLKTNKAIVTDALEKLLSTKGSPPSALSKSTPADSEQEIKTEDSNENQAIKKEGSDDNIAKEIKTETEKVGSSDSKKDNVISDENLLHRLSLQNQNEGKTVVNYKTKQNKISKNKMDNFFLFYLLFIRKLKALRHHRQTKRPPMRDLAHQNHHWITLLQLKI